MRARVILAAMAITVLAAIVASQAQEGVTDVAKVKDDLRLKEQILARQFAEFENSLLKLKDRLKRSGKQEDKLRAEILEKVLEQSKDSSISVQFEQMVDMLKNSKLAGIGDLKILDERSHKLADDLRDLLAKMREDPRHARLRDERLSLEKLIKEIERIIHAEKVVQGQTDRGKTDSKELKNNQGQITKATGKIAKELAKRNDKEGEKKNGKAEPKEEDKDAKKGEGKADAKKGAGKEEEGKKGDPKQGDAKEGDPKKGDNQKGDSKQGDKSDSKGQPKNGDKSDQNNDKEQPQLPKDNAPIGKKQVEDAEYKMKQAEEKIARKDNKSASDDQGKAIQDLEKAKKKLEDLLRQLREEELERLLAALQARCEKMLAMQIQVQIGTESIFKIVRALPDKKATRQNQQDSLKLSDNEKDIVTEANKAIEILEAEGSAVAFPEVFQQVRQDMMHVQRRLEVTDVGVVTLAIEKDIIDTLKEMIEALKKARQDMDKQKSPPSNAPPPPPQDQKLLEQIAELKMIRSMQVRVNNRTETYGKMYEAKEGEQTADPNIRRELVNLSERQERIFDVTNRIAKGDNK